MKDLKIISDDSGAVDFSVLGKSEDTGLMLLQRLYILLLSDTTTQYRGGTGYTLLNFLEGGNIPNDGTMNSMLAISCSNAVNMLDDEDRDNIASFSGQSTDGNVVLTLTLADGTTVKGAINNG